jgi:hypothetical protein
MGYNYDGQVGIGSNSTKQSASLIFRSDVSAIAAGPHHTCVVIQEGLSCWGRNTSGSLGNGSVHNAYVPLPIIKAPDYQAIESYLGTWQMAKPSLSTAANCDALSFSISRTDDIISISSRVYNCGTKTTTLKLDPIRIDANNELYRTDTNAKIGYATSDMLAIRTSYSVSGTYCDVAVYFYPSQTGPVWSEWYKCGTMTIHGQGSLAK